MTLGAAALGVTIDGYAVEGGYDFEGAPYTSFSVAQSLGRVRSSLRSAGTFEHLDELVRRAADLGCGALRLTLEWARLEPRPDTRDLDALSVYERALRVATAAGLSTAGVLCDAAWPSWLGREPWLSSWAPERFAEHAGWIAERLEGVAHTVVTFRSPNRAAGDGWCAGVRPPHRTGADADALSAIDGMCVAHVLATQRIAAVSPAVRRAILFEADATYAGGELWRDVAAGVVDPALLAVRQDRFERGVPRGAKRASRRLPRMRLGDVAALRCARLWRDAPECEWWLASDDPALLAASVQLAGGAVTTVELGAGARAWASQLATAEPLLSASTVSLAAVHLYGLVSSTGPLHGPAGLLDVDQRDGDWTLGELDVAIGQQLARLRGEPY